MKKLGKISFGVLVATVAAVGTSYGIDCFDYCHVTNIQSASGFADCYNGLCN